MTALSEKTVVDGGKRLLVSPDVAELTASWFDPGYWGEKAQLVATGGRGGAWFVSSPVGDVVLREYRRGGVVSRISSRSYFFSGYSHTRSFAEFRLLRQLRHLGLPVPEPLAALADQNSLFTYQASIIIRRIPNALPLPEAGELQEKAFWLQVGAMIRRFHDVGLYHSDLNCDNILVADGGLYLIDFDKCHLRKTTADSEVWKSRNLSRLKRSVHKRCRQLPPEGIDRLWLALCEGYRQ